MTSDGFAPGAAAQGGELFGPDPASDPLAWYQPPDAAADAFAAAPQEVASAWRAFAAGLAEQCQHDLAAAQPYLDRHVQDLGLAFRVTGDDSERAWPLNPMPVMLGAQEWAGLVDGLVQRADLLEAVIADIYGPQQLVSDGQLPAAVLSGSADFARRMVGIAPPGGKFLRVYAVDLARGPTGEWRVLADRVRLTTGIGYALENRLALGRATGGLLASIGAQRQSGFFDALRQGIAADCERNDPRIGLLTPGRFNQSYPEQALLARQLGFSLVEGRDLAVHEGKLFVRTISGLKRIDALWRWIRTRHIDPLTFDARSQIGVPNLVTAAEAGLVLFNWPGVGVVESRAMPAFLPRLAKLVLGEPLKLPNAATWWLGGENQRREVLANLDRRVISSAFHRPVAGLPDGHTRAGQSLTTAERAELEAGIARRPMDYTAQEIVRLSTTPALVDGRLQPRGFTLRAFLARDGEGNWVALPGGFARVSQDGDLRTSLMGLGDISTDVCIIDSHPAEVSPAGAQVEAPAVRREQGLLPSQTADNLFWMGRYGERAHQVARIIRTLVEQVAISGEGAAAFSAITRLANLLRRMQAVPRQSIRWQPSRLAGAAMSDQAMPGSVKSLCEARRQIALLLRDRLTRDSWRTIQRATFLEGAAHWPAQGASDLEGIAGACDRLIESFAALSGLMADGLSRGTAWSFLELGTALERGSMILQTVQELVGGAASSEDLSALLDLVDGQTLYRSRYFSAPFAGPILDMVLLDPAQPRGLAFQLARIEQHLAALPSLREDGLIEEPLRQVRQLRTLLESLDAADLDLAVLDRLGEDIGRLSDAISARFFLQDKGPVAKGRQSLLG